MHAVERGEPFLTNAATETLIREWMSDATAGPSEPLTHREQEVLKLIAEAHTNREIGEILHLSEKTVESHRGNILRKLGMRDRVELVRYAIRRGSPGLSGPAGARRLYSGRCMQNPRARLALMAVSTLALLAIAGFVIFADPGSGETKPAITDGFAGAIRPRAPAAGFTLADQDGRNVAVAALRGRPVVVTCMYTTCKNDCPTMTQQIRGGALDDLGHDVPVLAVSVDPANDTPGRARAFLAKQQMTDGCGSCSEATRSFSACGDLRDPAAGLGGREHSASVILLDDAGVARVSFPVDQLTPEGLAHDLRALERTRAQS